MAGDRILRIIIAGNADSAIGSLEMLNHSLEKAHAQASEHGSGIASAFAGAGLKIAMVAAGAAVSAGVIADELYKMGAPYEQLLNQIQAFTHTSNAQIQSLAAYLYQISPQLAQYGLNSEDAADAVAKLTKAGLSLADAQEAVLPTLALSKAGMIDSGEAANYVAEAMNVWGLKAKDVTMISNALVGASHSSTATVTDLGDAMSYSAAAAAHAGLSFQQTAAFMAEVANAGINGSKAGTSLKDMLVSLEKPTGAAAKDMKTLGINVYDSHGKMKDFGDIIGILHDKLSGLSQQQQAMYVKDIFGKIPMEAALTIVKGGTGAYQKYLDLVSRTGEAADIAGAKSGGLSGAIAKAGAQLESMGQALYLKVAPTFTRIVNAFANALPKLGGLASKAVGLISNVFQSAGGSKLIGSLGRTLQGVFQAVLPLVQSGMSTLSTLFRSAKTEGVFSAIGKALQSVGSLVTGTLLPNFKQFVDWIVNNVVPKVVPIFQKQILPAIKGFADFITTTVVPKVKGLIDALQPFVLFVEQFITGKLVPLILWAIVQLKPVFKELGGVISSLLDFLKPLVQFLTPIIEWLINSLSGPVIGAVKGFFNGLVRMVTGLLTILKGVLDFLTGVFTLNWSKIWKGITEIFSGIFNTAIGFVKALIFGKLVKFFLEGFDSILGIFKGAGKKMTDFFTGIGKWIVNFWKAGFKDQLKLLVDGWKAIAKVFEDAFGEIRKFLSGGWKKLIGDAVQWGKDIWSAVSKAWWEVNSAVITGMLDFLEAVVNGGVKVVDWFKNLPGTLLGLVKDAGKWLLQAGKDIVSGLISGITSKAGDIGKAVGGIASKVKDVFKSALSIFSPSRVFHGYGVNTMEGYHNGVIAMTGKIQAAMNKMGRILPNLSGHLGLAGAIGGASVNIAAVGGLTRGGALAGVYGGAGAMPNVTVNVAGHVTTEKSLAKAIAVPVRDAIRQIERKNGGRSGL